MEDGDVPPLDEWPELADEVEGHLEAGRYQLARDIAGRFSEAIQGQRDLVAAGDPDAAQRILRAGGKAGQRQAELFEKVARHLPPDTTLGDGLDVLPDELTRRIKVAVTGREMSDEGFRNLRMPLPSL